MPREVDKPFAGGRWSRAKLRQAVTSALRRMYWPPIQDCLEAAKRKATAADKKKYPRVTYVYKCAGCNKWFPRKQVEVDHIEQLGDIFDDADGYLARLLVEEDGLQVLCKGGCHRIKSEQDRRERSAEKASGT